MCKLQIYNSPTDFYEFSLEGKSHITVGRYYNNTIKINSNFVSRNHCSFIILEKEKAIDTFYWVIKDDNSSNGTWVNNNRIRIHTLKNKDSITFKENHSYPLIIYIEKEKDPDTESKETGVYDYEA